MKNPWVGFVAALISASSLIPTLHTVVKRKSTDSINYLYVVLGFVAQLLWLFYAGMNSDWPVAALASFLAGVYIVIAVTKWHYERTCQDVHCRLKSGRRE